jgi:salicylate hydroxylase
MAVEDGIVLAECISRATVPQALPLYLSAFESIRKDRTFAVQSGSVKNMDFWHMEDSARQRARDAFMKGIELDEATKEELKAEGKNPNQWADPQFQQWLFGYDALAEAQRALDKLEGKTKEAISHRSGEQSAPLKTVTVN